MYHFIPVCITVAVFFQEQSTVLVVELVLSQLKKASIKFRSAMVLLSAREKNLSKCPTDFTTMDTNKSNDEQQDMSKKCN